MEKLDVEPSMGEGRVQSAGGGAPTGGLGYGPHPGPHPSLPRGYSQLVCLLVCLSFSLCSAGDELRTPCMLSSQSRLSCTLSVSLDLDWDDDDLLVGA